VYKEGQHCTLFIGINSHSISEDSATSSRSYSRQELSIRFDSIKYLSSFQPPNIQTSHNHAILHHHPPPPRNARSCSRDFVCHDFVPFFHTF
jgi:hypothetical protein